MTRSNKMPGDEAAAMVHDWMELFPVAIADVRILSQAIQFRNEHDFDFWDSVPVQAARAAGVSLTN